MMNIYSLLLFVQLAFIEGTTPLKLPSAKAHVINRSWVKVNTATEALGGDAEVGILLALKQRNMNVVRALVKAVSDPDSPKYGKYMTLQEISDLVAPPDSTLNTLNLWTSSLGARSAYISKSRDFMVVKISLKNLESNLNIKMHQFKHKSSERIIYRTLSPVHLPRDVSEAVEVVVGLTDFFEYDSERAMRRASARRERKGQGSAAPEILPAVRGSEKDITANVKIYCPDGSAAKGLPACNPVAKVLEFKISYSETDYTTLVVPIDAGHCKASDVVTCQVHTEVVPYHRVNLTARVNFSDSSSSPWGSYLNVFSPSPWVTPRLVKERYNIPEGLRSTHPSNSQSVVGFEEQYISLDDLSHFFQFSGLPNDVPQIVGPNDPTNPGGEATLDIQWVMAIGSGVPTTFWSVVGPGPTHGNGAYILDWAMQIADTVAPPLVTSISYGDTEQGFFDKFGNYDYIHRMNDELAKMALRGLTVVAGSGDAGASNVGEDGNDISDTDPTCTPLRPFFPSNSPYVVSVSSTFFSVNALPICQQQYMNYPLLCSQLGEVAVSARQGTHWTTGGGFSNLTSTASWQQTQVEQFLQLSVGSLPPSNYWNASGRAYPDVSTVGFNLFVVLGGEIVSIGGTSASGPILAGIFGLLNGLRLSNGKPPLGLVTPTLYKIQASNGVYFRDIVVGENFDGDLQQRESPYATFCPYGFSTQVGWDAVTGLGTPNFQYLSTYFGNN